SGVPYNIALVLVGLLVAVLGVIPREDLDPELVLVGVLPVLVFEGGLSANLDHLRESKSAILTLAIPGVALSLVGTAAVATWALELPFATALVLGALLAITDTVSVLLAFREVRVPQRLAAIMEGESLFNDGTALVLVATTAAYAAGLEADPLAITRSLLVALIGGVVFGLVFGAIGAAVLRASPDHVTAVLVTIVVVFGTSLAAEKVHASPVIAVVIVGLVLGRAARRTLPPSHVLTVQGFWETIVFTLNVFVFLLVGMNLDVAQLLDEAPVIALAVIALHAGRALAIYGPFALMKIFLRDGVPLRWQHVMLIGNIKGALSMAAVLALPASLPDKSRLVTIVFGVTLVTLLGQALPFKRLLKLLDVGLQPANPEVEAARARLVAARRGQTELDSLVEAGLVSRREHAERKAALQRIVLDAERVLRGAELEGSGGHIERAVLDAQRAALVDGVRRGILEPDAVEKQLNEIEERILRLREEEEH
ncbi:MAG TPA: sodium:proton antiporter, partial [Sandaracinaceae bacterium]